MARYFFHLTEDMRTLPDDEGIILSDDSAVWGEAIKQIRSMVAQETRETGQIWLSRHIDVTDTRGIAVMRIAFGDALNIRSQPSDNATHVMNQ